MPEGGGGRPAGAAEMVATERQVVDLAAACAAGPQVGCAGSSWNQCRNTQGTSTTYFDHLRNHSSWGSCRRTAAYPHMTMARRAEGEDQKEATVKVAAAAEPGGTHRQ